jgi:acyl-CoA reductase-like NAD-dependent aldehyde dehydrogenase
MQPQALTTAVLTTYPTRRGPQVDGCVTSKFRNAGQTCVCANRIFVHDAVYDAFRDKLVAKVRYRVVAWARHWAGR